MDRATELELIDEVLELKAAKSAFLDDCVTISPVEHYTDEALFRRERETVHRRTPHSVCHSSELPEAGAFLRRDLHGLPVLVTRDKSGGVRAFLNVCRHRGARLVEEDSGCRHRFTCPYHAWTYDGSGALIGAPHFAEGFDTLAKEDIHLARLPAGEKFGLVWVVGTPGDSFDFDAFFAPVASDLEALGMADMHIAAEDTGESAANWKILVEGGIEAYHFKIAHRETIGPFFEDNLSTYRAMGPHLRSILPRTSMAGLEPETRDSWRVRDHANVLYSLFPCVQLLVQQDHVVWITQAPLSAGRTGMRLCTLAPEGKDAGYWRRNHAITITTLKEDFDIGEGIQAGLASGANKVLTFGRFEGALDRFNKTVADYRERGAR